MSADRQAKIAAFRTRVWRALARQIAERAAQPPVVPAPRYNAIWADGVRWLDAMEEHG